jgi:hypothetical protein
MMALPLLCFLNSSCAVCLHSYIAAGIRLVQCYIFYFVVSRVPHKPKKIILSMFKLLTP